MTTENNLPSESTDKPKTGKGSGRGVARPNSGRKPYPPELKKLHAQSAFARLMLNA